MILILVTGGAHSNIRPGQLINTPRKSPSFLIKQ